LRRSTSRLYAHRRCPNEGATRSWLHCHDKRPGREAAEDNQAAGCLSLTSPTREKRRGTGWDCDWLRDIGGRGERGRSASGVRRPEPGRSGADRACFTFSDCAGAENTTRGPAEGEKPGKARRSAAGRRETASRHEGEWARTSVVRDKSEWGG